MARPDLYPSHGPVSSYSWVSCKKSAAESIPPPHATPADPHSAAAMTNPLYDRPRTPNDGQFYPIYPEFYDFGNAGHSTAAAAATGGGGEQPAPGFPEMGQIEGGYPPSWDYGLGDVELALFSSPPGIVRGEEDRGPQPRAPWDFGTQAYPAMTGGGTMATASPMSQYLPAGKPLGGYYEPLDWPRPPMGQISPSPSQSSYHASSPASVAGPQFSRHNSCSSLPASRAAAVEQTRVDARFQPVPDHAVSAEETVANRGFRPGTEPSSSARQKTGSRRNARNQTMTATTTTDYNAGTLCPAITPSPKDSTAAVPYQPVSQGARRHSEQQTSKSSGKSPPQPAVRKTAQQQQQAETGQQQAQAQPQPQSRPSPQAGQPRTQRPRSRAAAKKCRAKAKLAVADLESTERAMSSEHRELSATARGLRDEVLLLKNELLAHGNCDDSLIQQYHTNQARMVGNGAAVLQHQHQHRQRQHH
ncbi:hypothetical protein INS49_004198 [Diaporthe citri]|uniref:uncharacterized protein n=1 Tax=Diaporthe citri TaxID=83186 RepID=UPI001C80D3C9|nr:uncharacterized protein INS49_004198 [Diaporthe citri]KAG6355117.1 hypothetical protein INS49_004198 [Diaporthe citri]